MSGYPKPTFRDPAGFVQITEQAVIRHVYPACAEAARRILQLEFIRQRQLAGGLIAAEVDPSCKDPQDILLIHHPRIFFPSYPWEWSPAQWKAAADLTLSLCEEGIAEGVVLKDATPLNVLFNGARPVFVDILSFEHHPSDDPIWLAQGQFIRTFTLPLIAHKLLGWPLSATQVRRDGYEPGELAACFGPLRRLNPRLLMPVTLPAILDRGQAGSKPSAGQAKIMSPTRQRRSPELARAVLKQNLKKLHRQVSWAVTGTKLSRWSQYSTTATHYSPNDHEQKKSFLKSWLQQIRPAAVLDIGSNTGAYSLLAAEEGARVVAIDSDVSAVERLWLQAKLQSADILPLVVNIARPTPATGWENAESMSFLDRAERRFDMVLMLAVIHHLLLMDQIPLESIAALAARLTKRYLILEWIPQADPMFQQLLRGREALYAHLTQERMEAVFSICFDTKASSLLKNGRTLFVMEKR